MENERSLTWAALLGRWVQFAQSALALPDDAAGQRWKQAVPDIIGLQALAMALAEADGLPLAERQLAVDRTSVLLDRHKSRLDSIFGSEPLHPSLRELVGDASEALQRLVAAGSDGYDAERS
jgi:hypothetical protein